MAKKILIAATLSIILGACQSTPYSSLSLISIVDVSKSAHNDKSFSSDAKKVCHAIASLAAEKDSYIIIPVDSDVPIASDPEIVVSRDELHSKCNNTETLIHTSEKPGTKSCKAWERALDVIHKQESSAYRPIIINQIQANEGDPRCTATLTSLMRTVTERQGLLMIINSTNEGNTDYNQWIWDVALQLSSSGNFKVNVKFYNGSTSTNLPKALEIDIREARSVQIPSNNASRKDLPQEKS